MARTIVDIHVIQTIPPSNVNRDDTGSPKSAVYGGVRRARVSSQAWKRATRVAFTDRLPANELGVRSTRIVELVADRITALFPELTETASAWAEGIIKSTGIKVEKKKRTKTSGDVEEHMESGYLVFLSAQQLDHLARTVAELAADEPDPVVALKGYRGKGLINTQHSVDIALFGRMVADVSDLNVDAAAQVAHAISVHGVSNEYDYFTAVDDEKQRAADEDAGAGMIGTVEFNSSTLYRYATVDVDQLRANLGSDDVTRRGVEEFIRAFATSMPTGKQNTFANRTLPDAIIVTLRETQPINLVGAFETPVAATADSTRLNSAATSLASYTTQIEDAFGQSPVHRWVTGLKTMTDVFIEADSEATPMGLEDLIPAVGQTVANRLGETA